VKEMFSIDIVPTRSCPTLSDTRQPPRLASDWRPMDLMPPASASRLAWQLRLLRTSLLFALSDGIACPLEKTSIHSAQ
jgi:hypothetical protein